MPHNTCLDLGAPGAGNPHYAMVLVRLQLMMPSLDFLHGVLDASSVSLFFFPTSISARDYTINMSMGTMCTSHNDELDVSGSELTLKSLPEEASPWWKGSPCEAAMTTYCIAELF